MNWLVTTFLLSIQSLLWDIIELIDFTLGR